MTVSIVDKHGDTGRGRRIAWWAGAAGTAFLVPMILGFLMAHRDEGGPMSDTGIVVLGIMLALLLAGIAVLVRWRHLATLGAATRAPSERANHRLLGWAGATGGVIGLATAIAALQRTGSGAPLDMVSGAIPVWLAVAIALIWGVVVPVISWRWHQVVDEHEREAYRDGAVAGYYVMGIGAPVWWFLWRGGLVPAVDAFWLFIAVMVVSGAVWMWRKYA